MKASSISVVIPTYNGASTIAEALESVLAQSRAVDEVVVVDDGSTDGTLEIVDAVAPLVRVVRQSHFGEQIARNFGLLTATSECVTFLDQDDIWHGDHVATLCAAYEEFAPKAVAPCYLPFTVENEVAGVTSVHRRAPLRPQLEELVLPSSACEVLTDADLAARNPSNTLFASRDDLLRAGGFYAGARGTADYLLQAAMHRYRGVVALSQPSAFYRLHESMASNQYNMAERVVAGRVFLAAVADLQQAPVWDADLIRGVANRPDGGWRARVDAVAYGVLRRVPKRSIARALVPSRRRSV